MDSTSKNINESVFGLDLMSYYKDYVLHGQMRKNDHFIEYALGSCGVLEKNRSLQFYLTGEVKRKISLAPDNSLLIEADCDTL